MDFDYMNSGMTPEECKKYVEAKAAGRIVEFSCMPGDTVVVPWTSIPVSMFENVPAHDETFLAEVVVSKVTKYGVFIKVKLKDGKGYFSKKPFVTFRSSTIGRNFWLTK